MDFSKFNSGMATVEWSHSTEGFGFKKIKDFFEEGVKKVQIFGLFFSKSPKYGLQPNAILEDCILNLPKHLEDSVKDILGDPEAVMAVDRGECWLRFTKYESKYKTSCYGVRFVNGDGVKDGVENAPF